MSHANPTELRIELAQGHWSLGECEEALVCLERALQQAGPHPEIRELARRFHSELEIAGVESGLLGRARALCEAPPTPEPVAPEPPPEEEVPTPGGGALATATMAELLASQGHRARALEVAREVLRRNPYDERALALEARLAPEATAPPSAGAEAEAEVEAAFVAEPEPMPAYAPAELELEPEPEPEARPAARSTATAEPEPAPAARSTAPAEPGPMPAAPPAAPFEPGPAQAPDRRPAPEPEPRAARSALEAESRADRAERERVLRELSRWLDNARRRYARRPGSRPEATVGGPSA